MSSKGVIDLTTVEVIETDDHPRQTPTPELDQNISNRACNGDLQSEETSEMEPPSEAYINANIPRDLKEPDQWVVWKSAIRDGNETKIPLVPQLGSTTGADTTDPNDWASYDDARQVCDARDDVEGIGFVFTEDGPYVGIDLDDVFVDEDGDAEVRVSSIIQQFDESFIEVSPSGNGLHIITKGELPGGRNKGSFSSGEAEIEMYETSRYFTVTGAIDQVRKSWIGDDEDESSRGGDGTESGAEVITVNISNQQTAIDALYTKYIERDESENDTLSSVTEAASPDTVADDGGDTDLDDSDESIGDKIAQTSYQYDPGDGPFDRDEELIEAAKKSKNGQKFRRLWRGEQLHYESPSEANIALLDMLAFWTQGDPYWMDRLFRQSGQMRNKWDEPRGDITWGWYNIQSAINYVDTYYDPNYGRDAGETAQPVPDEDDIEEQRTDFHEDIEDLEGPDTVPTPSRDVDSDGSDFERPDVVSTSSAETSSNDGDRPAPSSETAGLEAEDLFDEGAANQSNRDTDPDSDEDRSRATGNNADSSKPGSGTQSGDSTTFDSRRRQSETLNSNPDESRTPSEIADRDFREQGRTTRDHESTNQDSARRTGENEQGECEESIYRDGETHIEGDPQSDTLWDSENGHKNNSEDPPRTQPTIPSVDRLEDEIGKQVIGEIPDYVGLLLDHMHREMRSIRHNNDRINEVEDRVYEDLEAPTLRKNLERLTGETRMIERDMAKNRYFGIEQEHSLIYIYAVLKQAGLLDDITISNEDLEEARRDLLHQREQALRHDTQFLIQIKTRIEDMLPENPVNKLNLQFDFKLAQGDGPPPAKVAKMAKFYEEDDREGNVVGTFLNRIRPGGDNDDESGGYTDDAKSSWFRWM